MLKTAFFGPKMLLKKLSRIMTSSGRHKLLYDTHPEEVINCATFDVCTLGSFGVVKTHTHNCAYILDVNITYPTTLIPISGF